MFLSNINTYGYGGAYIVINFKIKIKRFALNSLIVEVETMGPGVRKEKSG